MEGLVLEPSGVRISSFLVIFSRFCLNLVMAIWVNRNDSIICMCPELSFGIL